MIIHSTVSDYTEAEFLKYLNRLFYVDGTEGEETVRQWRAHFRMVTEHPAGTDLLYWPETGKTGEPEEVLKEIREWRKQNGKPGFKQVG